MATALALLDVARILVGADVAELGRTLFLGETPALPHRCLILQDYAGEAVDRTHDGGALDGPRVQVLARDETQTGSRDLAEAAYRAFLVTPRWLTDDRRYPRVAPLQSPFGMGRDDQGRRLTAFNVQIRRAL